MGVGGPDCFPYLFINVLFSPREAVRQTGSYTPLLDDFLHCVNIFQLRCNISVCKVFWISYRQGQHWILLHNNRQNSGRMSIITVSGAKLDAAMTSLSVIFLYLFQFRLLGCTHYSLSCLLLLLSVHVRCPCNRYVSNLADCMDNNLTSKSSPELYTK